MSCSSFDEDHNWKVDQDMQLIKWHSELPNDWQIGGENCGFLFGNSTEGQLADAESHDGRPCLGQSFKVHFLTQCETTCILVFLAVKLVRR